MTTSEATVRHSDSDFVIGVDDFRELTIRPSGIKDFYYFYDDQRRTLIKEFVFSKRQVDYVCRVVLIKKDDRFSPRLEFSIRNTKKTIVNVINIDKLINDDGPIALKRT